MEPPATNEKAIGASISLEERPPFPLDFVPLWTLILGFGSL
jgi:hypothetical protein